MICMMLRSNFARLRYTTRAMACETASTEYGWRTLMNSRMTSALPSRYPMRTPAKENALEKVRRMMRFLCCARYGRMVPRENSK